MTAKDGKKTTLLRDMLVTYRRVHNISLIEMSKRLGVANTVLFRFEKGNNVRSDMAIKIILQLICL